jgi:hypothetical protein
LPDLLPLISLSFRLGILLHNNVNFLHFFGFLWLFVRYCIELFVIVQLVKFVIVHRDCVCLDAGNK